MVFEIRILYFADLFNLFRIAQGFLNYGSRNKLALCFVPQNFENSSSVTELLEKIMAIAHIIGKSENLGTKIDKLELDSECGQRTPEVGDENK